MLSVKKLLLQVIAPEYTKYRELRNHFLGIPTYYRNSASYNN